MGPESKLAINGAVSALSRGKAIQRFSTPLLSMAGAASGVSASSKVVMLGGA